MPLHVYTASAGAGKTHTLTREYLRLALSSPDPRYFTTIQAVTFTKKATGEMKERIVDELHRLAEDPKQSAFADDLQTALKLTGEELQKRASRTLRTMLLDYNAFRVRTIDSFFQEVVRSFARELGHSGALKIELTTQPWLRQAVLEVLSSQDRQQANETIRQLIEQLIQDSIEDGERFSKLEKNLTTFAKELEVETVKLLRSKHEFPTKENVAALRQQANTLRKDLIDEAQRRATSILNLIAQAGIKDEDILYKKKGPLSPIRRLQNNPNQWDKDGQVLTRSNSYLREYLAADDPMEKIVSKEAKERFSPIAREVKEQMLALDSFLAENFPLYQTTDQLRRYLGRYNLLIDIDTELQRLKQEGGLMFISDAPSLISSLLEESPDDAPFLYEKLGARIRHHMIDEFQDTSALQYSNFKPLLKDSLAEDKDCLIVGDAKQSIYRFRNSDSSLLTSALQADFAGQIEKHTLQENWRSTREIILFNNKLYTALPKLLHELFNAQWEAQNQSLGGMQALKEPLDAFLDLQIAAYDDAIQELPSQKENAPAGQVVVHRYFPKTKGKSPADTSEEEQAEQIGQVANPALAELPYVIIDLQKRGYRASDIAILVRNKKSSTAVSEVLLSFPEEQCEGYSLHFVSEEALRVGEAFSVRFLIACLGYIAHESHLTRAILQEAYHQLLDLNGSESTDPQELSSEELEDLQTIGRRGLYEVVELLIHRFHSYLPESEGAYLVKFLDQLYAWGQTQVSDIPSFLAYWQDQGAEERIVSAASDDALQLMTIHKSKGLGFPVVLLPDLSFDLDPSDNLENILWCPFPDLPALAPLDKANVKSVPLRYHKKLRTTFFAQSYYEEQMRYQFDALNLLYVATTRPKQELHLWLAEPDSEKEKKGKEEKEVKTMEDLLLRLLKKDDETKEFFVDIRAEEAGSFTSDLRTPLEKDQPRDQTISIISLQSYPLDTRLAVLREGLDYFTEESQRRYGRTMHLILSRIETEGELAEAMAEAVRQGYITQEQTGELERLLKQILDHPDARRWFDGSGEVYNERAIIGGRLTSSRRPDRVIIYPDGHVEIVDYKFGKEEPSYRTQVRRYMDLLRAMGYEQVLGYLCYLQEEGVKIVEVSAKHPAPEQ